MIFKDYYKILGLDNSKVSSSEIKAAYREQAKKYHPDVNISEIQSKCPTRSAILPAKRQ